MVASVSYFFMTLVNANRQYNNNNTVDITFLVKIFIYATHLRVLRWNSRPWLRLDRLADSKKMRVCNFLSSLVSQVGHCLMSRSENRNHVTQRSHKTNDALLILLQPLTWHSWQMTFTSTFPKIVFTLAPIFSVIALYFNIFIALTYLFFNKVVTFDILLSRGVHPLWILEGNIKIEKWNKKYFLV